MNYYERMINSTSERYIPVGMEKKGKPYLFAAAANEVIDRQKYQLSRLVGIIDRQEKEIARLESIVDALKSAGEEKDLVIRAAALWGKI